MKLNIPENPRNIRVSTYLTADEVVDLAKLVGDQSLASWLRNLILEKLKTEVQNEKETFGDVAQCNGDFMCRMQKARESALVARSLCGTDCEG